MVVYCAMILRTCFNFDNDIQIFKLFQDDNGKPVWLDYVLVIAAPDYVDTALTEANIIDYTREFIEKCANNHYYINSNETGQCLHLEKNLKATLD